MSSSVGSKNSGGFTSLQSGVKVKVFTKDPCPYCVRAIRLLTDRGIPFEEVDLTLDPEQIHKIKQETGWRTVPMIFINGNLVGGYDDLKKLDEEGVLQELLQQ